MPNSKKFLKYFQPPQKIPSIGYNLCKSWSGQRIGLTLGLAGAIALSHHSITLAQTKITGLTATYESGSESNYDTTTADPCTTTNPATYTPCGKPINMKFGVGATNDYKVRGFTSGAGSYSLVNLADDIKFRRINNSNVTGERQLMLFERDTTDATGARIRSSYANSMEVGLLSNIANRGIDNAFSNDASTASNNIERIDYIINSGIDVPTDVRNDIGFLILERGGNDPFKIAAITSLDAQGNPASFAPVKNVTRDDVSNGAWGRNGPNIQTSVMRREENETNFRPSHTVPGQIISGIYFSLSDLNVPANQPIYGYALFPNDTPANTSSNDLVNLTGFPTDTSGASGEGGLDLMAGGGIYLADSLHTVSGTLYEDTNSDNSFNNGEATLPNGINVILYRDTNSNGEYDSGVDERVQTNSTARGNGGYNFIGVADGTYRVFVNTNDPDIPSNLVLGTPNNTQVVVSGSDRTAINFGFNPPTDYGDAPISYDDTADNNNIINANDNPARHAIAPNLYLGSIAPDAEAAPQSSTNANGDDNATAPAIDDEDAFTNLPNVTATGSYSLDVPVTNTSGGNATLHGWIDFNKNGKFELGEYQSAVVNNNASPVKLTWAVPAGTTPGNTHARFRLTSNTLTDNGSTNNIDERSIGNANNGEVEDYQVAIEDNRNRLLGLPFTCDSTFYITIGEGGNPPSPQFLYTVNRSGGTYNFVPIGSGTSEANGYSNTFRYNALAYNPKDNYLYGVVQVDSTDDSSDPYFVNNIVKIGSDGVLHSIGIPEDNNGNGLPTTGYYAASILADGTYIIGKGNQFAKIDLDNSPPKILSTGSITGASFTDFAVDPTDPTSLSGARIYGINESAPNRLVILDARGDNPEIIEQATNPTGFDHNAGSQFVDSFGTLYYRSNSDRKLYQVDSDPESDNYGVATEIAPAEPGGNHDGASCLFASVMQKEVQDLDGNIITTIPAGETVNYVYSIASGNVDNLGGVTFEDDLRNVASGDPINGTYTGNFAVSNGTGTVSFNNDNQTIEISNLTIPAQTGGRPGETLTITAEVKIPSTLAVGDYYNQAFISSLPSSYPSAIASDYPPSAAYEDPTPLSVTEDLIPNLALVKRITAINPGQSNEIQFNSFVNDDSNNDGDPDNDPDNAPNWPDNDDIYLRGATTVADVKPGDEVEYTIYFLSNGDEATTNVKICDVIPDNMNFVSNSYDNDFGIALLNSSASGATATNLSNFDDTDEGTFIAPGIAPPTVGDPAVNLCRKVDSAGDIVPVGAAENINGAIVVEIDSLPEATSPGTPANSYGFIRFRAEVQ